MALCFGWGRAAWAADAELGWGQALLLRVPWAGCVLSGAPEAQPVPTKSVHPAEA